MSVLPKISIITPSFNQGRFIEDAILSVLNQNYPCYEHIIIDGGSTDETLKILRKYSHLIWISEPDKGQTDALNKGFKMATGDIIGWLNTDEYYLPGAFEAIADYWASSKCVDVIYGCCIFVDRLGKLQRMKWEHKFDRKILLFYGCYIPSCATFFRKQIVKENLLDINFEYVMDFEYFVRLAMKKKVFMFLERPLAAFRWHSNNKSRSFPQKTYQELRNVQRNWSLFNGPDSLFVVLSLIFRAKRIMAKIGNGGYLKELKAKTKKQSDTRWFLSEEGKQICRYLINI